MCPFYCATERISALTLYSVFSSLLLPQTANFLDTRWEPPSLQTPVACLSAYLVLLSHLEFPMKKQQQTKALLSIQQCYSEMVTTQKGSSGNALCLASYRSTSTCQLQDSPVWEHHGALGLGVKAHWQQQKRCWCLLAVLLPNLSIYIQKSSSKNN